MSGMKSAHHSASHSALQPHPQDMAGHHLSGAHTPMNSSSITVATQPQEKVTTYSSIYQHHQNGQAKVRSGDQRHVVLD